MDLTIWRSDFLCYQLLLKLPETVFDILREFVKLSITNTYYWCFLYILNSLWYLLRGLRNSSIWFVILPLDDYIWVYLINCAFVVMKWDFSLCICAPISKLKVHLDNRCNIRRCIQCLETTDIYSSTCHRNIRILGIRIIICFRVSFVNPSFWSKRSLLSIAGLEHESKAIAIS